jgi:O-methyltransferase involved in polyketide biosynthesis
MDSDFSRVSQAEIGEEVRVAVVLRCREFDRDARDFLARYPEAVVVHMGCGLDARFERVDNGRVDWKDGEWARDMMVLPRTLSLSRLFTSPGSGT